jgi:RNA polymerase sigma-70 factor (ECF subfamily)
MRSRDEADASHPALGADESFRRLFEDHYRRVSTYFLRLGFSHEEAEDLTQDTFLRVFQGIKDFRGEAHYATWLFTIARNIAFNEIRRRTAAKRQGLEIPLDASRSELLESAVPSPEADVIAALDMALSKERLNLVRAAVSELAPRLRESLLLRIDHGLQYREIAVTMRVSVDTVKAYLLEARRRLQALLESEPDDAQQDRR